MIKFNLFLFFIGWITIICLYNLNPSNDSTDRKEIVLDGNNLFSTAVFYMIGCIICFYIDIRFLRIIICGGMVLFSALPVIISTINIFNPTTSIYRKSSYLLNSYLPLIIAINCILHFFF